MMRSPAHEGAHGAALATEAESNLLADKTGGANDEMYKYLLCFAGRALLGRVRT